jgi:predicted DNA-binding antitoxin AbrB/MazE fold protein
MAAIKAHYDGHVFVPDGPVPLRPGEQVVIQRAGDVLDHQAPAPDVSFLRKLDIELDARSLREIVDDPELALENL